MTDPVVKPVSPEDAAAETANPAGPSGTTEASEPSGTTEPSGKTEPSGTTAERRTADEVTSGTSAAPRSAAAAEIALTAPAAEEVRGEEVVPEGTLSLEALSPVPLMELDAPASSTEVTERSPAAAAVPLPAEHAAAEREAEAEMSGSAEPPAAAAATDASRWSRAAKALPIRRPAITPDKPTASALDVAAEAGAPAKRSAASERPEADSEEAATPTPGAAKPRREVRIAPLEATTAAEETARAPTDSPRTSNDSPAVGERDRVAPVISAAVARLKRPIEQCLERSYRRPENAAGRSAWGMLHAIMVYGVDTPVVSGRRRFNAISWLAGNNVCRGQRLLTVDREGIAPRQGVGLQGHQGQLLAVLGLVGVPQDYPLYAEGRKFTVADLIAHEQRECRSGEELTFTLIGLAHYLDTDSQWQSKDGETWDFQRLLREELAQPVVGAACGGTHRLMGLSHALRIRQEEGLPLSGQWARTETFMEDFTEYAWKLQNRDGSMSTEWFEGRGDSRDLDRKIQTTGHIVEWMLCHTPDEQLQDERMVRAVRFLASAMARHRSSEKAIGPKGHALRSLALYYQRVFQEPSPWDPQAGQTQQARRGPAYR